MLRSGLQASADKKRVIDTIMENISSKDNSVKSSATKSGRLSGTKRLRNNVDNEAEPTLVFTTSALK